MQCFFSIKKTIKNHGQLLCKNSIDFIVYYFKNELFLYNFFCEICKLLITASILEVFKVNIF